MHIINMLLLACNHCWADDFFLTWHSLLFTKIVNSLFNVECKEDIFEDGWMEKKNATKERKKRLNKSNQIQFHYDMLKMIFWFPIWELAFSSTLLHRLEIKCIILAYQNCNFSWKSGNIKSNCHTLLNSSPYKIELNLIRFKFSLLVIIDNLTLREFNL